MPVGEFLEAFPTALFVLAHAMMVGIGAWAIVRTRGHSKVIANALWLYLGSQPVFFAFWAGWITLKMTAVTEQTLIMAMVLWLAIGTLRGATRSA